MNLANVLLPRPRRIETTGGQIELSSIARATVEEQIDPRLDARGSESYRLVIGAGASGGARVQSFAAAAAGMQHARATLAQIHRLPATTIPAVIIEDWPSFPVRGVMLDVSRNRVPTMAALFEIVDLLSTLKINHLQLYTEHAFAYAGHEDVWRDASPMTPDEVMLLDRRCAERGIELAANQNCFGHLTSWLKLPRYAPLAETHGVWDFYGHVRSGPFSLCPIDPGSIALVEDLLVQLLACHQSRMVNIGCDETADVGQGRSQTEVARRGRADVYLQHLRAVDAIVRSLGRRSLFWADIALSHPEALVNIPEEMVALAWGYEPDSPFDRWLSALRGATSERETWVCPGTSSWRAITGRTTERRQNLEAAATHGVAGGARGYLVTDWGDLGHRQVWPISLIGIAEGAARAWNAESAPESIAVSTHAFGDASGAVAAWLAELGDADRSLRAIAGLPDVAGNPTRLRNSTALFVDLEVPLANGQKRGDERLWRETLARITALDARRPASGNALFDRELAHAAQVACLAAKRALLRFAPSGARRAGARAEVRDDLTAIIAQHRELWLARSRPGGLAASTSHYERALAEVRDV